MKLENKIPIYFLIFLFFLFLISFWVESFALAISLSATVAILIIPMIRFKGKLDLTSPVLLTFIYLLFAYPIKFIAFRLGMPYLIDNFGLLSDDVLMTKLFLGLFFGLLSYLLAFNYTPKFLLGYFRRLKFNFNVIYDRKLPRKIFLIYLIGISSFIIQLFTGFYTSFAGGGMNFDQRFNVIFANAAQYTWYGLFAGFLWITKKEKVKSVLGNILVIIMLIFSLSMGIFFLASKTYLIYPVLFFILALSINKVKIKMPILIIAFTIVVFFTFLFIPQYRSNFVKSNIYGSGKIDDYLSAGQVTIDGVVSSPPDLYYVASSIINRFSGLDITSYVFANVPQKYEYFYFAQLGSIVYSLIPRFIYPEKPIQDKPIYFSIYVQGMRYGGSSEATPLGEGFMNLGYIGVLLLFGIWGFLQSILYHGFYLTRKNNFIAQVIYIVMLFELIGFGGWIVTFLAGILQYLIFLIPLVLILRNKRITDK